MTEAANAGELVVLSPGLHTLVVDQGRPSSRALGLPTGGAADRWSFALGNALVGNRPDAVALEINLAGPTLVATCPIAGVVCGGDVDVYTDQRPLQGNKTFTLRAGETLTIAGLRTGMRAYLCVQGGLQGDVVLGSCSSLRPLRSQERIGCREGSIQARSLRTPLLAGNDPLRILWGSHADWFDRPAFLEQGWVVTPLSNRIGLRLRRESVAPMTNFPMTNDQKRPGLVIGHWEIGSFPELVSEPVCPGTMQVTPDGQCVILGVDGQTIGGYPRLAHVISADLDRVGQLRPGQQIRFQPVTLEEAEEIFYTQQQEQKSLLHRIALAAIWPTGRELLS